MIVQEVIGGLTLGCIYALVALGFVLIYKTTEIINFAQGEFMTLGAFIAFTLITSIKLSVLLAIPITLLLTFVFGILLDRCLFRKLIGEEAFALVMVTIGISIGMRSLIGMVWTYDTLSFPQIFSKDPITMLGVRMTPLQIGIISSTIAAVALLYIFFKYTRIGIAMQAAAQN